MKNRICVLILSLCTAAVLTACGERQSVAGIGDQAEIKRDKKLYENSEEVDEESVIAEECLDYIRGTNGKEVDYYKAAEVIKDHMDSDNPDILYCLGIMHDWPMGIPYDHEASLKELEKAELGGNYYASIYLGLLYEWGTPSVEKDYTKARDYFRRAILNGVVEGYYGLGNLYAEGKGLKQDVDQGIEYYNKVINEGTDPFYIAQAKCEIAGLYYSGDKRDRTTEDDDPEYDTALKLFEESQKEGCLDAIELIGYMYICGYGVEKDVDKGIELYEKAANAGDISSMRRLGWLYANGNEVEGDSNKALEWFNKAADLNDPQTLFSLGQIYESGSIVEADPVKAKEYYEKAEAAGYEG